MCAAHTIRYDHRGPARRQPFLSGADQGILIGSAKGIVLAHCLEQFFSAGCDVFCRDLRARLFWDIAASGAGRRRPGCHCDRMDIAQAARRRKRGGTENSPAAGHNPPGILSLDIATNRRPWINLRCDYVGRERGSPSRVPFFDNPGCTHWTGTDRDQHFDLLWIFRPVGTNPGTNGDDGNHAIVVLFPGLYRCADRMERDEALLESVTLHITDQKGSLDLAQPAFPEGKQMIVNHPIAGNSPSTSVRCLGAKHAVPRIAKFRCLDELSSSILGKTRQIIWSC
jgi:hypothetical protein